MAVVAMAIAETLNLHNWQHDALMIVLRAPAEPLTLTELLHALAPRRQPNASRLFAPGWRNGPGGLLILSVLPMITVVNLNVATVLVLMILHAVMPNLLPVPSHRRLRPPRNRLMVTPLTVAKLYIALALPPIIMLEMTSCSLRPNEPAPAWIAVKLLWRPSPPTQGRRMMDRSSKWPPRRSAPGSRRSRLLVMLYLVASTVPVNVDARGRLTRPTGQATLHLGASAAAVRRNVPDSRLQMVRRLMLCRWVLPNIM